MPNVIQCECCAVEIPASFTLIIQKNECPGCGGEIVSAERKALMDELTEKIREMSATPEDLASWLIANFDLLKKSDEPLEAIAEFHGPHRRQVHSNQRQFEVFGIDTPTTDPDLEARIKRRQERNAHNMIPGITAGTTPRPRSQYQNLQSLANEINGEFDQVEMSNPYGDDQISPEEMQLIQQNMIGSADSEIDYTPVPSGGYTSDLPAARYDERRDNAPVPQNLAALEMMRRHHQERSQQATSSGPFRRVER